MDKKETKKCSHCNKQFLKTNNLYRHIRNVHKEEVIPTRPTRIICPICFSGDVKFPCYKLLHTHLLNCHNITIVNVSLNFSDVQEFEQWMKNESIRVNYAISRIKETSEFKIMYYDCNRSDIKAFQSKCTKRKGKSGGSIKMKGVCPSRLIINFQKALGTYSVKFCKTHVGHEEIRSRQLDLKQKKEMDKLKMEAVNIKVQEWNSDNKNFAFIFKKEGEKHPILEVGDFVLGFMNTVMEDKLRHFSKIICINDIFGTNKKGVQLTLVLVKDDKNAGFPVAFFLTNRQDQIVQEVFLRALQIKVGQSINADYFMTDDDGKFYNAWVNVMEKKPQRLLCTWHVTKNWNIEGRTKIKSVDIKKTMKSDLNKIINEKKKENFVIRTEEYMKKLTEANETEFLNYLKKYYFQSEERISMWAHSYWIHAGIDANMSLESLNNLLKTNQIKRGSNIIIEKFLDNVDKLVDEKMWQEILHMKRPNANTYQDKVIMKAHNLALKMDKSAVTEVGFGEFKVRSSSEDLHYNVTYNKLCESECKTIYCRACKICIHRYKCECQEYAVKNTICKHVHLICLYEKARGDNSVLEDFSNLPQDNESTIKIHIKEEIDTFIDQKNIYTEVHQDRKTQLQKAMETYRNTMNELDDETFQLALKEFGTFIEKFQKQSRNSRKRKMDKQEYFPMKKK